jgi:hypothetical protein|tara:strand:- start:4845 stop:5165 length:321 start_codon:yes stop_codon:yes gene_type:complete
MIFYIIGSILIILLLLFLFIQAKPNIMMKIDARKIAKLSLNNYVKNKKNYDCYIDKASDKQYLGTIITEWCTAASIIEADKEELSDICKKYKVSSIDSIYKDCNLK